MERDPEQGARAPAGVRAGRTRGWYKVVKIMLLDDRQLRLLHLQPSAVPGRAGAGGEGRPQRRDHAGGDRGPRSPVHRHQPGALHAQRGRGVGAADPALRGPDPYPGGLPGAPGDRAGLRRPHRARPSAHARQDLPHPPYGGRRVSRAAGRVRSDPLPLPGDRALEPARLPRGDGLDRRRGDHGGAAQGVPGGGRAVPSGVHPDPARARPARQLSMAGRAAGASRRPGTGAQESAERRKA
ncbi:MAG: hypothetical protein KatS3mg123_1540 [Burkholderiales bacterium]|nr:MAG: hypothetical protein KatS3mg123_1540 [Burkholderiales bacterium]